MKLAFLQHIFEKFPRIKSDENIPLDGELFQVKGHRDGWKNGRVDRQTDRETDKIDEANSRFSQFCEGA